MNNPGLLFLIIILSNECQPKKSKEDTENTIREEVLEEFNTMYDIYAEGTDEYFNFYEQDFVRVGTDGNMITGIEQPKKEWNKLLSQYHMKLINYGQPKMLIASGQVVTINSYEEIFVHKDTSDTTLVEGVYIATWRRQNNDSWKISMDTWHAEQE